MAHRDTRLVDSNCAAVRRTLFDAVRACAFAIGIAVALCCAPAMSAPASGPATFASPEQAVDALLAAARGNNAEELLTIFGPAGRDLVSSGDEVADREARARLVEHFAQGRQILRDSANRATLVVGAEEWPFPIPLVREGGVWHFDAAAGAQEILNRRIGRNELNAMEVCRSFVHAQRDYAADLRLENLPAEYAQKFVSSPGRRDGLYWTVGAGEKQSPIGPQMARARAEGYGGLQPGGQRAPYHGYYYRVLTRQGASAPGGARDYVDGAHMTGGFALIAFPAKYGDSGIMTFIVNQDGIVFQRDLGPDTASVAAGITEFNPDRTWKTR
jgi:hypothetical protein